MTFRCAARNCCTQCVCKEPTWQRPYLDAAHAEPGLRLRLAAISRVFHLLLIAWSIITYLCIGKARPVLFSKAIKQSIWSTPCALKHISEDYNQLVLTRLHHGRHERSVGFVTYSDVKSFASLQSTKAARKSVHSDGFLSPCDDAHVDFQYIYSGISVRLTCLMKVYVTDSWMQIFLFCKIFIVVQRVHSMTYLAFA